MTRTLSWLSGLIVVVLLGVVVAPARAQGPYYALPSWDQKLPAATRFVVLLSMDSAAVLDRETGLVWERFPSSFKWEWGFAIDHCRGLIVGNRRGWRLPAFPELSSLQVASQEPALPVGHPFGEVQSDYYWSATTVHSLDSAARVVAFFNFGLSDTFGDKHLATAYAWCVRGGQGVDPQ